MAKEFQRIHTFLKPLSGKGAQNLCDDVAIVPPYIVSTDTLIQGVHFIGSESPKSIAQKVLAVNLSDIASKGGTPYGYTLNLTLPTQTDDNWLAGFCDGLKYMQEKYDFCLLGGDTTHHSGGVIISVTIFATPKSESIPARCNAQNGDIVCITGCIGTGGYGLLAAKGIVKDDTALQQYQTPVPHITAGKILAPYANAMCDISDGLFADIKHISNESNMEIHLQYADIPVYKKPNQILKYCPYSAGDDYVLARTIPESKITNAQKELEKAKIPLFCIGKVVYTGNSSLQIYNNGKAIFFEKLGFEHV